MVKVAIIYSIVDSELTCSCTTASYPFGTCSIIEIINSIATDMYVESYKFKNINKRSKLLFRILIIKKKYYKKILCEDLKLYKKNKKKSFLQNS